MIKEKKYTIGVNLFYKWPDLNFLIEIKSQIVDRETGLIDEKKYYYISSAIERAEYFLKDVRNHRQIENNLHWVFDVVFKEMSVQ